MRYIYILLLTCSVFAANRLEFSFNSGELSPLMKYRVDLEKQQSGIEKAENILVKSQGAASRRPGTKLMNPSASRYKAVFDRDITWQYINGNGKVFGIPYESSTEVLTLDAGRRPRLIYNSDDSGQDLIGIPLYLHPFKSGQYIHISPNNGGADDFDGNYQVQPETTENEIVIKSTWSFSVPSTFTGDETIYRYIAHSPSAGRMDMGDDGWLYVANGGDVARISEDFLIVNLTYCVPDGGWPGGDTPTITGLELTDDKKYLYVLRVNPGRYIYKFKTADGSEVWRRGLDDGFMYGGPGFGCGEIAGVASSVQSYDIAVDSSDSVYIIGTSSKVHATCLGVPSPYDWSNANASKYLSDGTFVDFYLDDGAPPSPSLSPFADGGVYGIYVDDDMGLVIGGGGNWWSSTYPEFYTGKNLWIRSLDNSSGTAIQLGRDPQLILGTTYKTDDWKYAGITTLDGYIFVANASNNTLYKLDTGLNILDSIEIEVPVGIFPDAFGNLVVVRSSGVAYQKIGDCLWYYDSDLNYLGKSWFWNDTGGGTLIQWYGVGSAWTKGDWVFKEPVITTSDSGWEIYDVQNLYSDSNSPIRLIPFEFSTTDAYVLGFGDGFMQVYGVFSDFYEDFESDNLLYGGWITSGSVGLYTRTGIGSNYYAGISAGSSLTKIIMPAGEQLYLTYKRQRYGTVEYSVDGSNWVEIEDVTSYYFAEAGFVFPSSVSNYSLLYLRFRADAGRGFTVDNIYVTSAPLYSLKASNPDPEDGETDVAIGADIYDFYATWDENIYAQSYNIYFGTTNPPPYIGNDDGAYYYPYIILDYGTTYYWQVDCVSGSTITTGDTWSFSTVDPPDLGDYIARGGPISPGEETILEITRTCPAGDISFWNKTSIRSSNYLRFYIDGDVEESWGGITDWKYYKQSIEVGEHTFKWSYASSGSAGESTVWLDNVTFPDSNLEDFETGDFSSYDWVTSGDVNWVVAERIYPAGIYSAESGDIDNSESSTVQFTADCSAGNISFYVKTSSEGGYDELVFYIDDAEQESWSGASDWKSVSYAINAGERTFKWVYEKDSSVSDGSDCGWIDDVNIPGTTDDFETGDFSVFDWVLSGDADWSIVSTP